MIFDNVKVGDQFKEKQTGRIITVTELTEMGCNYICNPYNCKLGINQFVTVTGGQLYTNDPNTKSCWIFFMKR